MKDFKIFWIGAAAVVGTIGLLGTAPLAHAATEQQAIGKVISVKHSGYATRLQQSVKQTIKEGDVIHSGDLIDVKSGNVVQVALDSDKKNVIHIQGDSLVQMTKDRAISLELSRGKVFALLDKLEPAGRFRVVTPTAVTTVRGTYFQVKMAGSGTESSVYRGEVAMNGRQDSGKDLGAAAPIKAGQKAVVDHMGTTPSKPQMMSAAEFEEINDVIRSIDSSRKPLSYTDLDSEELGSDAKKPLGSSDDLNVKKPNKSDEDEAPSANGKVVF